MLRPIAKVISPFKEKFSLPHQAKALDGFEAIVEFYKEYSDENAVRGLSGFSHIWLIWEFSLVDKEGWSPTVRPPRLGGNKRMGVFATRSPFRPNRLGLSLVKLVRIEKNKGLLRLVIAGADMADGTPVYDIKPYIEADVAQNPVFGFALGDMREKLSVVWQTEADLSLYEKKLIENALALDPRPAYQKEDNKNYGVLLFDKNIRFYVEKGKIYIYEIEVNNEKI